MLYTNAVRYSQTAERGKNSNLNNHGYKAEIKLIEYFATKRELSEAESLKLARMKTSEGAK